MFLWVWTLGLAFGGFTLCLAKGSTYYILLAIFNSFLWTLNKVCPLRAGSHYGRPSREAMRLSGQTLLRVQRNELK
jgi:hypothetical protein